VRKNLELVRIGFTEIKSSTYTLRKAGDTISGRQKNGGEKIPSGLKFSEARIELKSSEENSSLKTFDILAYTGAPIQQGFSKLPITVNLNGLTIDRKPKIPILRDHTGSKMVGHTEKLSKPEGKSLRAEGVISATGQDAKEIIEASENGFPLEASIGAKVTKYVELSKGESRLVNGREVIGPHLIAERSVLKEISIVALGADENTQAIVAEYTSYKEKDMNFEAWLAAKSIEGFDELSEAAQVVIKAQFNSEIEAAGTPVPQKEAVQAQDPTAKALELLEKKEREIELKMLCNGNNELFAEAVKNGWSLDLVEAKLEVEAARKGYADLKASTEQELGGFNIHVKAGKSEAGADAVEAALCISAGLDPDDLINPKRHLSSQKSKVVGTDRHLRLSEEAIDAAHHYAGLGMTDLFRHRAAGAGVREYGTLSNSAIRAALSSDIKADNAFMKIDIPHLFVKVIERIQLRDFDVEDTIWQDCVTTRSVRDFREVDVVQFGGLNQWQKLAADGRLTQGEMSGSRQFSNKAETYGQINYIDRKHIVNDDLGFLTSIGAEMARWGSLAPEVYFHQLLTSGTYYDGTNFFNTAGATINDLTSSPFSLDALDAVDDAIRTRKHPVKGNNAKNSIKGTSLGQIIKTPMTSLIVPTEIAREVSRTLLEPFMYHRDGDRNATTDSLKPTSNYHHGKYQVKESRYLSDSAWSGSGASATTWYMAADKRSLPMIEFAFLNGVQTPTVEPSRVLDDDRLGIKIRGYFDFGGNFMQPEAAFRCQA